MASKGPDISEIPEKRTLSVLLAAPRGFCAGVERAIQIVERAIAKYGAPVYVRHEIVHNRVVVEGLEAKGAIFVEELDAVPTGRPVVFSAHGVPKSVPIDAATRKLLHIDATCPLVSKVHVEAERHFTRGLEIILIGHAGHPEVIGTMGQLPKGAISLIETIEEAEIFKPRDPAKLAYVTQTTLSIDDTAEIVAVLKRRFPSVVAPRKDDICYATSNRQDAVKAIAERCDLLIVLGAPNSSNACRLVEVAARSGAKRAVMIQRPHELDPKQLDGISKLGITAGASAPESLVQDVLARLRKFFSLEIEEIGTIEETVHFKLPRLLDA
ncbi:MAG: 4-hydroxy-3-methylbut-2-enyl diphosphate reductase [Hyphomicrobiales bacterium]|nr:4-hydroxy-3-methylbut-2-enyl diphosphate reductase [Hyphomicrobiales bacterium]